MTKERKQLLLKDLCARLPYGVKVYGNYRYDNGEKIIDDKKVEVLDLSKLDWFLNGIEIKPYLRPMSSMTEEEKNELRNILWFGYPSDDNDRYSHRGVEVKQCLYDDEKHSTYNFDDFMVLQNFLLKNHFDYCGLIPRGLALEAPKGMYNIK